MTASAKPTLWLLSFGLLFGLCSHSQQNAEYKPRGVWTLAWSADGNYIALGGDDSILYILKSGDYTLHKTYRLSNMLRGLAWHPSENLLAVATAKQVQFLDLPTGTIAALPELKEGGRGIGWNHSGELLAIADGSGVVQILNKKGKLLRSIPKHNRNSYLCIDWHPSKNILVTGSDEIIVFDTSGKQLAFIKHRKESTGVLSVQWHPSGSFFASGDYGHEGENVPTLLQFWKEDGTLIKEMKGSKAEYRNMSWNKSGTRLATASDALRVWTREGTLTHTGKSKENLWGIDWSPKGDRILTASFEGTVNLWTSTAGPLKTLK